MALAEKEKVAPGDGAFGEDLGDIPESFTLSCGTVEIEMVLVRGGDFMMGFDGRHSMDYRFEPVDAVRLGSFNVSQYVLTKVPVDAITYNA